MLDYEKIEARTVELCEEVGATLHSRQTKALLQALVEAINDEMRDKFYIPTQIQNTPFAPHPLDGTMPFVPTIIVDPMKVLQPPDDHVISSDVTHHHI